MGLRADRRAHSVYLNDTITEAYHAYRNAGMKINLSRIVAKMLVDKFIQIEKGRRLTGDPFLYTPAQLAKMKADLEDYE